jgi:hypothetical protein
MNSSCEFEFFFEIEPKRPSACLVIDADCVVDWVTAAGLVVKDDLIRLREKIPSLQYHDLCALRDEIDRVLALPCMKRAAKAHKRTEAYFKDLEENRKALDILEKMAAWPIAERETNS